MYLVGFNWIFHEHAPALTETNLESLRLFINHCFSWRNKANLPDSARITAEMQACPSPSLTSPERCSYPPKLPPPLPSRL